MVIRETPRGKGGTAGGEDVRRDGLGRERSRFEIDRETSLTEGKPRAHR